jgi:hypothetical protein
VRYEFSQAALKEILIAKLVDDGNIAEAVGDFMELTLIDQGSGIVAVLSDGPLELADKFHRMKG